MKEHRYSRPGTGFTQGLGTRRGAKRAAQPGGAKRAARQGGLRMLGLLAFVFALWSGGFSSGEAVLSQTITGFFADHLFLRPAMVQTTEYVDVIPPYTVVSVETVDGTWGQVTSPKGITGYVRYGRIQQVPEISPEAERYVYGEKRVKVRTLPFYDAPAAFTAEADELLIADGRAKGYLHVRRETGGEGYILPEWVKKAEFTPEAINPVTFCVREALAVWDLPLRSAHVIGTLDPEVRYRAEAAYGNYYAISFEGKTGYVEKRRTAVFAWRGGEVRSFFTFPRGGGARRAEAETLYAVALASPSARLFRADGSELDIPAGSRVYLYTAWGAWAGAVWGRETGYMLRREAEILTAEALQANLATLDLSGGRIGQNALLDAAFTLVERGNPFQARYNLLTGAKAESLLPLGVPYFWGGRSYSAVIERLPNYTTREAWQSSPVFYQEGVTYLYGFDCIGLVKAVYQLVGQPIEGEISARGDPAFCRAGGHIYCSAAHPFPRDWAAAARGMEIGDVMLLHHPGTHALFYMGTLRDYGYTAEQVPALAEYLDYPLMFQSGGNPYSYLRFMSLIETSTDARTRTASPTDGGAGVCILGVPREAAELVLNVHDEDYYGFDVEGSFLPIMYFGNVRDYFVWRPSGAASPEGGVLAEAIPAEPEFADPEGGAAAILFIEDSAVPEDDIWETLIVEAGGE